MRHKVRLFGVIIIVLIIVAAAYKVTHATISALPEPGPSETSIATTAKDWYISRAARGSLPVAPENTVSRISAGEALFGMGCATCHGQDGRKPTPIGESMYPRVLDLGSPAVQKMSDRELFWVIKNGIRLSGMPGFAKVESDEQIWELAYYVRSRGSWCRFQACSCYEHRRNTESTRFFVDRRGKEETMNTAVADWPKFLAKLKARQEIAERTMAFRFDKPASFKFTPGQFIDITLLNPPETDSEGNARGFSIASAPHEDFIMVATRLRDTAFKRVLKSVPPGAEVRIEGPFGNLRLHNDKSRAAVVLTGGIGITPFRSILLHAAKERLPHHIFLFYANRRPEDAAFLNELQELEKKNLNFKLIASMTQMEKSQQPWSGERGLINHALLEKYLKGVSSPVYYITGPPAMVKAMHTMLTDTGVDDDNVRIEEFAGY